MKWRIDRLYKGDHIRINKLAYYHHGIYIGDNKVIHFNELDGVQTIHEVSLDKFLNGLVAEKAIYSRKEKRRLRKPDEIVKLAKERIGEQDYNLAIHNCETFANDCCFTRLDKPSNIFKTLVRIFIKVTGFIPFILFARFKTFYQTHKAKVDFKKEKNGVLYISNHQSIFDYYVLVYKMFFKKIHTMVADVVFKVKGTKTLNNIYENIIIKRENSLNYDALNEARNYLASNKNVLIFPEGRLVKTGESISDIKKGSILLAYYTGKPIIPIYNDGKYGFLKRAHIIVGEKIYVKDFVKGSAITDEDIERIIAYIKQVYNKLAHSLKSALTYKTQYIVSFKTVFLDLAKILQFPIEFLIANGKKIYLGNKKEIKNVLKGRALIAPNHTGGMDVIFIYIYFFFKRVRIISLSVLFENPITKFLFSHAGVIPYRRESNSGFDLKCFKEANGVLDGDGIVAIFPEGRINKTGKIDDEFKKGLAVMSYRNKAPIIPMYFVRNSKPFRRNYMMIGNPIYPDKFINSEKTDKESIDEYNELIHSKMLELEAIGFEYRKKRGIKQ